MAWNEYSMHLAGLCDDRSHDLPLSDIISFFQLLFMFHFLALTFLKDHFLQIS